MEPAPPSDDKISVASCDGVCVARVTGRGTFKISGLLRDYGLRAAQERKGTLVLDLTECTGMDSTFMGIIASLAAKYKQAGAPRIHLVNLSEKTGHLVTTLGLQFLVHVHMAGQPAPDPYRHFIDSVCKARDLRRTEMSQQEQAKLMLEAHETLAGISEANREEFQDVIDYLRQDLRQQEGAPGAPDA